MSDNNNQEPSDKQLQMQALTDQVLDKLADIRLVAYRAKEDSLELLWTKEFFLAVISFLGDAIDSDAFDDEDMTMAMTEVQIGLMQNWLHLEYGDEEDE